MLNNTNPGLLPNGQPRTMGTFVPPSNVRTIGDALIDRSISWRYYGGGFNAAVAGQANSYCQICNPFQYATSIMANQATRTEHLKDTADLFTDIQNGTLPSVSFVKPDTLVDGHPQSSKLALFEAFLKNILNTLDATPLKAATAVFVAFDEGGGHCDSGFIQPLDFFGDGPRVPFIVVSPFSRRPWASVSRAIALFVLALGALAGCAKDAAAPDAAGSRALSPAPQEARSAGSDCLAEAGAQPEGARETIRGLPPPPGLVPPNASRVVAEVLKRSVWAPGTLPNMPPRVDPQQILHSLTLTIVSSAQPAPGQRNLAHPGSTIEAFSCTLLATDLPGKEIEGTLTLIGDTRGTRWWISNIRVLP